MREVQAVERRHRVFVRIRAAAGKTDEAVALFRAAMKTANPVDRQSLVDALAWALAGKSLHQQAYDTVVATATLTTRSRP